MYIYMYCVCILLCGTFHSQSLITMIMIICNPTDYTSNFWSGVHNFETLLPFCMNNLHHLGGFQGFQLWLLVWKCACIVLYDAIDSKFLVFICHILFQVSEQCHQGLGVDPGQLSVPDWRWPFRGAHTGGRHSQRGTVNSSHQGLSSSSKQKPSQCLLKHSYVYLYHTKDTCRGTLACRARDCDNSVWISLRL